MNNNPQAYSHPGQLIEALLAREGISQRVLAVILNTSESTVNKIVMGKRPVNAKLALQLEEVFHVPAESILELQQKWDVAQARLIHRPDPARATRAGLFKGLPVSEMIQRGWLGARDVRNVTAVESSLKVFFNESSLDDIEVLPHAPKKTNVTTEVTPAQLAWLYRVKQIASEMLVARYTPASGRAAVSKLQSLLSAAEETRKAPRILMEHGIRFVIVESLSRAKIDGVCLWLDESSPVIGMALRYDRIDNFWFVLRHELEHVLAGHGRGAATLDAELEGERASTSASTQINHEELIANRAAVAFCVPPEKFAAFVARKEPFFNERDIVGFARTLQVHPGLIAGQLQHYTDRFDLFRNHLVKIRHIVAPSATVDGWGDVYPVGL